MLAPDAKERDKDIQRKRDMRSEAARVKHLPTCENPQRRERCLADPDRFLKTYFKERYSRPFGKLHRGLIDSIYEIATKGGRQSVAAPRGRGKTEITKGMLAFIIFKGLRRFPVPIGQTTEHARKIYEDFRHKVMTSELLAADFPEVCYPVRDLEGAPQRAAKQHIDGIPTRIIWKVDELRLPDVPEQHRGPIDYGGVRMVYRGLDAAIRGINHDGDRPDIVIIDDPETRESAKSHTQIADREAILDRDVAGLSGEDYELAMACLTTVQNCYCLSYKLTDREQKPAWNGYRFAWVEKWPDRSDLWEEYMAIRQRDQVEGDRFGMNAVQFYLGHQPEMDAGHELLSDNFKELVTDEGEHAVHSAIQEVFNKISDTSLDSFYTEYQNDPPKDEKPETLGLTAGKVQTRISGLQQNELPQSMLDAIKITVGLDIGKYASHWTKIAWFGNATGIIIDYGVMETYGLGVSSSTEAIELALLNSMLQWRNDIMAENPPEFCLIDSGDYSQAVYGFVREVGGGMFAASKGWDRGRFRMGTASNTRLLFNETWAGPLAQEGIYLYNVHTEHWKQWLQQRFVTATFDDQQQFNDGSLSLFASDDRKKHLSFAHHIVAEEMQERYEDGKGLIRKWVQVSKNNHWLDSTALACAAAGCLGVRLIQRQTLPAVPRQAPKQQPSSERFKMPGGRPFVARR